LLVGRYGHSTPRYAIINSGLDSKARGESFGPFFIVFQPKRVISRQFRPISKLDYGTKAAIYPNLVRLQQAISEQSRNYLTRLLLRSRRKTKENMV
jgi:hypothetical protein